MKKILFACALLAFIYNANAQDLPENPEPGKCYVRCKTPDVWKNEDVQVETKAAYKKIITHPAEYETVTERVLIKEASKRLEIVPAVYETQDVTVVVKEASYRLETVEGSSDSEVISYTSKEGGSELRIVPATFKPDSETIEIKPKTAMWVMSDKAPDCESSDPNDCRYWCYKSVPAEYTTVPLTLLDVNAHTNRTSIPEQTKSYTKIVVAKEPTTRRIEIPEQTKVIKKTVMVSPPTVKEIEIPAEYGTITKVKLVKDAWEEEVTIPAEYKTITKEVLVTKGGLTTWEEVDCKLVEYNDLNINWNLASATLTPKAKAEIDSKLLPILKEGLSVEIASHTDSRGSKESNLDLSERRAQAVTNYLISKGINSSKIVSNGYGETKLVNRCSDGVSCTEKEHLANRRTQFRVINQ